MIGDMSRAELLERARLAVVEARDAVPEAEHQRRLAIRRALRDGWTAPRLAAELGVTPQTIYRWAGRWTRSDRHNITNHEGKES